MKLKNESIKELEDKAKKIREELIDIVSVTGGHLASNLGVVELTIALHHVFDSPYDQILWDVGHQSYVHKMLTGRLDKMKTIRQLNGLSPFTNPKESEHDHFISGHAGNTISAAYGIAQADKKRQVIAVVGDASLSNGQSLEGINNSGNKAKNMVIILNDNEMSIGNNVGALFKYLSRLMSKKKYTNLKSDVEKVLKKVGIGESFTDLIKRLEHSVRYFLYPGSIFEELGYNYIGPIDGHNLTTLVKSLNEIDKLNGPTIIHVKTQKGKGYKVAEKNMEKFHGVSPFNKETGELPSKSPRYSQVVGAKLTDLAQDNEEIIAISAAMINGTGLGNFFEKFPDRSYDVGIAEEHAVTFAGGLAIKGKKPVVAIYSTFLQRAYDQMIHDIALQNLPVLFIADRSGIVGRDGETHQGIFDISYINSIPNFKLLSPGTKQELESCIEFGIKNKKDPVFIRVPRSKIFQLNYDYKFEYGKWNTVRKGKDVLILATGSMLKEVIEIENLLNKKGVYPTIVSAVFIKPLDQDYLKKNLEKYDTVITLEESLLQGGFGASILEFCNDNNILKRIKRIGIKNQFILHGSRDEILTLCGLKGEKLAEKILAEKILAEKILEERV
ncbi:MAG: 1-deoxy-D-xylulose-5-phosphate synthase [Fusobacteriota bacterium]